MKYNCSPLIILVAALGLGACSPKNKPRQVHEPKREWVPQETPSDDSVAANSFGQLNLQKAYADLKNPDPAHLMDKILKPFSAYVLNARFVEAPMYRTSRMTQMIHVFHQALLQGMDRGAKSAEFTKIKNAYYKTVFAGCSTDLRRDCINTDLFSNDARFTRILTKLAQDLDADIEKEIQTHRTPALCVEKSETCRALLEERYRRMAMANLKKSRNDDAEFSFSYLKYARAFAALMDYDKKANTTSFGYIAEVHGKIFETIIARYNPQSINNAEFKAFVENFNPWIYSQKRADTFQYGTKVMFKFGAECCLYQDARKTQLSAAVKAAISESQKESDSVGLSFQQMVKDIQTKFGNQIFENLGMGGEIRLIENFNSSFYNEYFLVVDRLFRGHLNTSEVEMVLRNTPAARTQEQLPKMISTYLKVYLIHMVVETNAFMASIYTSNIASDKVFEESTTRSRELTSRWHHIQSQIDLLERVMGSYFKGQNLFSEAYIDTTRLSKSVNRNIHYVSVYPNMIVMTYFLSKMKGKIIVNTWWGRIEINADTILDAFFDGGVESPWFRFGKDAEPLDRQMLLYGWDYMLSTGALKGIERDKFFEMIFTKYIDENIHDMRKLISEFERKTFGHHNYGTLEAICDYELDNKRFPPGIKISFLELPRYTYSGLGDNGTNSLLNKLLAEPAGVVSYLRDQVDSRLTYMKAMIDSVEVDLLRNGRIKRKGEPHPDTQYGYAMIAQFEQMKRQIARIFVQNHKRHFECAMRLQEVERRRTNRLYEEERAHLGQVFDLIRPLVAIKDKAVLDQKVKEINDKVFKAANSEYRFDHVHGLTYRMSEYDLLMRTKKRIESDIFVNLNADERRIYGASNADYARPRNVTVFIPEGLAREKMVAQETANTLYVNGETNADREAFIREGMAAFNGKMGSFIQWQGQRANDDALTRYIRTLQEFYLLGPVTDTDGTKYEVTAEDLSSAYTRIYSSYTLDEMDMKYALELKNDGRFDRTFFSGVLFEENGARLPFFYKLMTDTKARAGVNIDGPNEGSTATRDAYQFAQTLINLRTFVFTPSEQIKASVSSHYGDRAHKAFQRLSQLFDHLAKLENDVRDAAKLDPRLKAPFYLQEGQPVVWYSSGATMVDELKRNDHRISIDDFARRTGDFYKTREKVKVQ